MSFMSISFIQGLTEDYNPGDSHSKALNTLLQRGSGGASMYMNFGGISSILPQSSKDVCLTTCIHVVKHTSW